MSSPISIARRLTTSVCPGVLLLVGASLTLFSPSPVAAQDALKPAVAAGATAPDAAPMTSGAAEGASAAAPNAPGSPMAQDVFAQNDLLNAALWQQKSVEAKANAIAVYASAQMRLDAAIADKSASAVDQKDAGDKPVAVILDLDETVLDNSAYESGLVTSNGNYSSKTWDKWTKAEEAKTVPGSLDFTKYADDKGVKVFYASNRTAEQEE